MVACCAVACWNSLPYTLLHVAAECRSRLTAHGTRLTALGNTAHAFSMHWLFLPLVYCRPCFPLPCFLLLRALSSSALLSDFLSPGYSIRIILRDHCTGDFAAHTDARTHGMQAAELAESKKTASIFSSKEAYQILKNDLVIILSDHKELGFNVT